MKSRLTEEEEVSDAAWQELCRYANDEWVGGGYVGAGKDAVTFYSSSGAMSLKFHAYKHNPDDPRVLYSIDLADGSGRNHFSIVFSEGLDIPATLDDFILAYVEKKKADPAYAATPAMAMRDLRKRVAAIKAETGYLSLAEVYEYVIARLLAPVEHEDVHTDTGFYEESVDLRLAIETDLTVLGE